MEITGPIHIKISLKKIGDMVEQLKVLPKSRESRPYEKEGEVLMPKEQSHTIVLTL